MRIIVLLLAVILAGCSVDPNQAFKDCGVQVYDEYTGEIPTEDGYILVEFGIKVREVTYGQPDIDSTVVLYWYVNGVTGECERDSLVRVYAEGS